MAITSVGALCFGFLIGWNVYYVNRYRSGVVGFSDIASLVGAVGGAAVLALFPSGGRLFAWYSIGLLGGFLAYFLLLILLVKRSGRFTVDFLLDGRAPKPDDSEQQSGQRPLRGDDHGRI